VQKKKVTTCIKFFLNYLVLPNNSSYNSLQQLISDGKLNKFNIKKLVAGIPLHLRYTATLHPVMSFEHSP